MMYISNDKMRNNRVDYSWHVGEVLHIPSGNVIHMQVDGDELALLIAALRNFDVEVVQEK